MEALYSMIVIVSPLFIKLCRIYLLLQTMSSPEESDICYVSEAVWHLLGLTLLFSVPFLSCLFFVLVIRNHRSVTIKYHLQKPNQALFWKSLNCVSRLPIICFCSARLCFFLLLLLSFGWRQQNRSLQNFTLGLISDFKLLKISNFKVTVSEAVCGWHLSQILQTWFALCFAKLCIDTGIIIYFYQVRSKPTSVSLQQPTH